MKTSSKAIIWILVVFALGIVFGGTLTFLVFRGRPEPERIGDQRGNSRKSRESLLRSMAERFNLDQEQQEKVLAILEESRDQFRLSSEKRREESNRIREATRQKIRALLKPEQLKKFDDFIREHRRSQDRRERREPRSPSP